MASKNFSIVIIEDEEVLSQVLKKKLQVGGYTVSAAKDGAAGLELVRKEKPRLVLLDIMLPKMDGYQVLEKLKADVTTKDIDVIVISNSGQPVEIKRLLDMGAKDYLIKADFTPEEVMEKVKSSLGSPTGEASDQESAPKASAPSSSRTSPSSGEGVKVLLIEDDKFLGEICSTKLRKEGFDVTLAIDGESGLQKAIEMIPDIILLDIRLPGMDGFQVLEKLKNSTGSKVVKIPVVIMSNFGQEDYISKAMALGATDYLVKANFTTDDIVKKIQEVLHR